MRELSPEALLQLAQYQPFRNGGREMDATFEHMIPAVLMESGGSVADAASLREAFLVLFGVEVEATELESWLAHLEQRGAITRDGTVSLSPKATQGLKRRRAEFEDLALTAKQEWRASLIGINPTVRDEELDVLAEDLEKLIGLMVAYHGAEAAVILYPEEPRSHDLLDTLHVQVDGLPERAPKLEALRRQGLLQFFSAPTAAQRRYLADRLDHGFFATVGTLRPSAALALRDELAGQRLYLDTNILYSVLDLAGKRVGEPAKRLLELTKGLGLEVAVTSRTIEEFHHGLRGVRSELEENLPARRFAGVVREAARRTGGVSVPEGFLESYENHGSTIADWFRRAAIIEPQLERLQINIVDDGLTAVLKNERDRTEQFAALLDREVVRRGNRPRSNPTLQHDAVHRLLIERLRGKSHRHFVSAGYWFLTEDRVLPDFGHMPLDGERPPKIPFAISASAWAQLARCFTPRTEHYDQMVTDLLASPYLKFGRQRSLAEVQAVVSRITTLVEDASPAVVAAFIGDETLEEVARASDPGEADDALVEEYERQEDRFAKNLTIMEERLRGMEARLVTTADEEDRTVAALREQVAYLDQKLEAASEELGRERSRGADVAKRLKEEQEARLRDRSRLKASLGLGLCAVILVALTVLTVIGVTPIGLSLLGAGALLALIVAPAVERSAWAWRAAFFLTFLGAGIGIYQLTQ